MTTIDEKYERLREMLLDLGQLVVAFSGGVDSQFLLYVAASLLGTRCIAVTVQTPMMKSRNLAEACSFTRHYGVIHEVIQWDALAYEPLRANGPDRCYHCKGEQFTRIQKWAKQWGAPPLLEGTNRDDPEGDRPGMAAARERGVLSPLRLVGLGKEEIRMLSRREGLPGWDRPPESCLATRIPTGKLITPESLRQVEVAEEWLNEQGFLGVRVRHHGDLARIELPGRDWSRFLTGSFRSTLRERFRQFGVSSMSLWTWDARGISAKRLKKGLESPLWP